METEDLKKILADHKLWLNNEGGQGADLRRADLQGADLQGADLQGADLRRAYLQGADLQDAYLQGADLQDADLRRADLRRAYLRSAYLRRAYLQGADLQDADLRRADLRSAYLRSADLRSADLQGAYIQGAYIQGVKNIPEYLINLYKKDLLYVLIHSKREVPVLKEKLLKGEINGSQYEGECCCLIGTLAKADGGMEVFVSQIPFYVKGLENYSEQLFWQIKEGDTPENNQFSKIALETIEFFEKNYLPKGKN